jgi:hypothetical protein
VGVELKKQRKEGRNKARSERKEAAIFVDSMESNVSPVPTRSTDKFGRGVNRWRSIGQDLYFGA